METRLVKTFTAGEAIEAHVPVTVSNGKAVSVNDPFTLVKGVSTHKANINEAVDVLMFGEGLVSCEGSIDGTKMLTANENGNAIELDTNIFANVETSQLACLFANPIETASTDAILNCFICPQLVHTATTKV